jgi:hypothetical protein
MNACDEEALNIVLRYERSDNGQQQMKKDGRRALFALMQTYSPVSTNAGNNAKAKLESTRFQQDKNAINQQITDFYINVAVLEAALDKKLETLELWAFITSAIKGKNWTSFRLTMSMQKECKDHQSFWFVDQVRKYILALEEDRDTSPPPENDLRDVISMLAASVEAIATKTETTHRVKSNQPYDAKMDRAVSAEGATGIATATL